VAPVDIYPALVKADCFRFRLDDEHALPEFAAWALTVGAAYDAGVLSSGSTRSRIPLSVMASRKIPVPPVSEQVEIARHIESVQSKFEEMAITAERAIELLRERRSALISAAVTGKIDVRQK
jgi:type I restriction enzyme S subunit